MPERLRFACRGLLPFVALIISQYPYICNVFLCLLTVILSHDEKSVVFIRYPVRHDIRRLIPALHLRPLPCDCTRSGAVSGIMYHVQRSGAVLALCALLRYSCGAVYVCRSGRSPAAICSRSAACICSGSVFLRTVAAIRSAGRRVPAGYNVRAHGRCLTPPAPTKLKRDKSESGNKK